jgi:hypothetical protein
VAKVLPTYFRWMAPIYVPPVTAVLFKPVCTKAGVKAEEVEEAPEFWPFLLSCSTTPTGKKKTRPYKVLTLA